MARLEQKDKYVTKTLLKGRPHKTKQTQKQLSERLKMENGLQQNFINRWKEVKQSLKYQLFGQCAGKYKIQKHVCSLMCRAVGVIDTQNTKTFPKDAPLAYITTSLRGAKIWRHFRICLCNAWIEGYLCRVELCQ